MMGGEKGPPLTSPIVLDRPHPQKGIGLFLG